ncbi:MAG: thioredoxin family protein [Actinomycetota bacterium]
MTRLIVLLVLVAVAVIIALVLQRRRPDPPSAPSYRAPAQLDRNDFARPETPGLIVVFASTTCNTCPEVWRLVEPLGSDDLAVQRVDVQDGDDLHSRYRIDGVPTTVLADGRGVVVATFFGPVSDEEFADAVHALRRGEAPS